MSDEERKDEEAEVEAHRRRHFGNDEPSDEAEVEAHRRRHFASDEPSDEAEGENDFEAHRFRKDRPKKD